MTFMKHVAGALIVATMVSVLCFAPAYAQVGEAARLTGTVYDSTEMRPLAGARVAVIGTSASADADSVAPDDDRVGDGAGLDEHAEREDEDEHEQTAPAAAGTHQDPDLGRATLGRR